MLVLSPDRRIAERLEDLASRLDAGLPIGEARHGQAVAEAIARNLALRPFEVAALQAGETAGRLPSVLRHLAAARHATAAWKGEVARALAYPGLLFAMCVFVALFAWSTGVAPRGWLVLSAVLLFLVLLLAGWLVARLRDPLFEGDRYPLVGRVSRCAGEIPYLVALQALYAAGVPVRAGHATAAAAAPVPWIRARLFAATGDLEAGEPLAAALEHRRALTGESLALVHDGEAAGQLEEALARAVTRRQREHAANLRWAARLLGAVAYAYAAGSVLWFALSFYGNLYGRLR